MANDAFRVEPLAQDRVKDFWKLHSDEVDHGWCCCTAWWAPSFKVFSKRTAEENKAEREKLFAAQEYDGYILYEDNEPIGWCQCGHRNRLAWLCQYYEIDPIEDENEIQAITCLFLRPSHRGKGLAKVMLQGVLHHLRNDGKKRVQAFPRSGDNRPLGEIWTGPTKLFTKAGFEKIGGSDEMPILELSLT